MNSSRCNRLITAAVLAAAILGVLNCGNGETLISITVIPSERIIVNGSTVTFIATATFSNGMTVSPWSVVNWSSADRGIATIEANGVARAISPGTTEIIATDMQHPSIFSRATLSVTNMPLVALEVTTVNPVIVRGTTAQMKASGIYADDSPPTDMTSSVIWTSSNGNVASISNNQGSNGLVTAITAGTVTITAIELLTGITAETVLIVTP